MGSYDLLSINAVPSVRAAPVGKRSAQDVAGCCVKAHETARTIQRRSFWLHDRPTQLVMITAN